MSGITILDEQHRAIIATINFLHYFIQQEHGLDALQPTLRILRKYMGFHLKTEEMVPADSGYPDIARKRKYDKQCLARFTETANQATAYRDPGLLPGSLKKWRSGHAGERHGKCLRSVFSRIRVDSEGLQQTGSNRRLTALSLTIRILWPGILPVRTIGVRVGYKVRSKGRSPIATAERPAPRLSCSAAGGNCGFLTRHPSTGAVI